MLFNYKYSGSSAVTGNADTTGMSFAPDTLRDPTYFRGKLAKAVPFREAISALHHIVVSDGRFIPKDKTAYKQWAKEQEEVWLAEYLAGGEGLDEKVDEVRGKLATLDKTRWAALGPFYEAQDSYFKFLYKRNRDWWYVLDPVITVHPDEVFFECFSEDESSYGRLGCSHEVFKEVGDFACGTTNIDYSVALYDEFQKIRDYKDTELTVDPSGFTVETENEDDFKEVKIDLPDSWVRGFLQVSSAMTLPGATFELHPMDLHNFCFVLKRCKEKHGPRSIRFKLEPGQPVTAVFEPWNTEVKCPRSVYHGTTSREIRIWGRRRLLLLERLIPVAKKFTVTLLGTGMPSFYVADLGDMNFTLGLSGWTANDWSRAGNFDLMAPRTEVDAFLKKRIFDSLRENWVESAASLASRLGTTEDQVTGALSAYTQAGRAIYDLNKGVYRVRELSRDPLPADALRFANDRESAAAELRQKGTIRTRAEQAGDALKISAQVTDTNGKNFQASLWIDPDQRLFKAECTCNFFTQNKLFKGPCEHILAARMEQNTKPPPPIL